MEPGDPQDSDAPVGDYSVREDAHRILREINPHYDHPEADPNRVDCEGPCCSFRDPEFWI